MSELIGKEDAIEIVMERAKEEIESCAIMTGYQPEENCSSTCEYYKLCQEILKIAKMTEDEYIEGK